MKLGFIKPNYPGERRVALLPKDVKNFDNEIVIEAGFGSTMDIKDEEYLEVGCEIKSRQEIFKECEAIFSLKLIQESDYDYLREGQMVVGWTHPYGSGSDFMKKQVIPKNLVIIDLDNIMPRVFYKDQVVEIDWIPRNFIVKNSINAGYASTLHALVAHGVRPNINTKIAVLAAGNVSQGAFQAVSLFGADIRMFYRKTMDEFRSNIGEFDIIINGIEVDGTDPIISLKDVENCKENAYLVDAAADAGNAIEGTDYTTFDKPVERLGKTYYYCINNSPTVFFRKASEDISESFSKHVYSKDVAEFYKLIKR